MYEVGLTKQNDFDAWLQLAREVEPLFGPMADVPEFREGLKAAMDSGQALCCYGPTGFLGGIVISEEINEIVWFAVKEACRGKGVGDILLSSALVHLDTDKDISVTTFSSEEAGGEAARKLYRKFGFQYAGEGPVNPAGVSTVVMVRSASPVAASADVTK